MNLIFIRFAYVIAAFIIAIILYGIYIRGDKKSIPTRNFSIFFLLFALYRFFLTTPSFIDNAYITALGYNVAVAIFFVMISVVLNIVLSMIKIKKIIIRSMIFFLLTIGTGVVIFQTININLPEVTKSGIVLWNVHPIAFYITGVSGFIVSIFWIYFYALKTLHEINIFIRIKNFFLMLTGLFLGLSSIYHFSPDEKNITLSFFFSFISIVTILIAFVFHFKKY